MRYSLSAEGIHQFPRVTGVAMFRAILVAATIGSSAVESADGAGDGTQFRVEVDEQGALIRDGERKVLVYQRRPKALEGRYRRANYVHPLYGLDGEVLTEDFPADHLHHRGIFWAWHQLWVGETKLGDGWATRNFEWDVRSVRVREQSDAGVALEAHAVWKSAAEEGDEAREVVEERTVIRVHRATEAARKIDFEIGLRALVPGVRIGGSEDEKGYGGFSVRVRLPEELEFIGEGGEVEPQTIQVEAGPWLDLTTREGGVAILQHPSLPGFPQRWILRRERSMQNPVFPGREAVALPQEEPLVLRYRLVVHRERLGREEVRALQEEYGREGLGSRKEAQETQN
jgi:hypothetical protein